MSRFGGGDRQDVALAKKRRTTGDIGNQYKCCRYSVYAILTVVK